MKISLIIFFILISAKYCAADCPLSENLPKQCDAMMSIVDKALNADFDLDTFAADQINKGAQIVKVLKVPTHFTCTSITYSVPEIDLNPGQSIYFAVPKEFRDRPVTMALLDHRQDPDLPSNKGFKLGVYSTPPGRTSFQVYTHSNPQNPDGEWRYYNNPNGGVKGSKFAEPRYDMEHETLFGWYNTGHGNANTDHIERWLLKPDVVRLVSVGKNPVIIGGITLEVSAPKADSENTVIFSSGTEFGEHVTEKNQRFGGGQSHYGHYPEALALGVHSNEKVKLPKNWKLNGNNLFIPIDPGKKISQIEVAVGDTHPDYDPKDPNSQRNEDGGYGTSGWSKLSLYLQHSDGTKDVMVNRENVPPQGVVMGSPPNCNYVTKPGDSIVIQANDDTSYIMGVRIGTIYSK